MIVKILIEHHLKFLILKERCRGSSEPTLVKMSNCWKSHALAQIISDIVFLLILSPVRAQSKFRDITYDWNFYFRLLTKTSDFFLKAVVNSNIASQHQRENLDHYKSTMDHPKMIVSNQKAGLNKNC